MAILGAVIGSWLLISSHFDLPYDCHVNREVDGYLGPHDASSAAYNAVVFSGLARGLEYTMVRRPCFVMQLAAVEPKTITLQDPMPEEPLLPMTDYVQVVPLP